MYDSVSQTAASTAHTECRDHRAQQLQGTLNRMNKGGGGCGAQLSTPVVDAWCGVYPFNTAPSHPAGVSAEVLEEADACAVVPMVGMVESLNVSVAAALMLHEARRGRVAALVRDWELRLQAAPALCLS